MKNKLGPLVREKVWRLPKNGAWNLGWPSVEDPTWLLAWNSVAVPMVSAVEISVWNSIWSISDER